MKCREILNNLLNIKDYCELVDYMKDSISISENFLYEKLSEPIFAKNNLLKLYISYVWRFMFYLQEIAASNDTVNVLGVNSMGRSALEAYAIAIYVFQHRKDDKKVLERILYTDLKQTNTIIEKYDNFIANHKLECKNQESEREINLNNFTFIVDGHFAALKEVLTSGEIDRKKTLEKIIKSLYVEDKNHDEFDKKGINISYIIEKALDLNKSYKELFNNNLDYTVLYAILCSSSHSNYTDVLVKTINPNNQCFAPDLYPNENDELNKKSILNILYSCMIDALKGISEF